MTFSQNLLKDIVNSIVPTSKADFRKLASIFSEKSLKKGSKAIIIGETNNLVLFVTKGLLREYTIKENEDHTLWISGVGEAILDPGSFMFGEPSKIEVEALVNSHILYTTREQLVTILFEIPSINAVAHVLYQKNLQEFREHMLLLKIWPTQKRQEILFEKKPHLLRREVKLKHIASLLNVHPNSLSRIRNQRTE
jgi:CRP-like cAMP-binding protein